MVEKDLYSVLGVASDASQNEIRDAYIRISRVVHPDRFNENEQPVEWRQANKMLKEANQAYEILSDTDKRAQYDRARASSQSSTSKRGQKTSSRAASNQERSGTATSAPMNAGRAVFSDLPENVRKRLLDRQDGKAGRQWDAQTDGVFWKYVWLIVPCGWFWLLFTFASENQWGESELFWLSLITVAVSLFIGRQAHWIWRWHKSNLKCRFYVTPLYFVQAHLDEVRWWPLLSLQDLKVTHNHRNGGYQNTDIQLIFSEETWEVTISSKHDAESLLDGMRKVDQKMRQAAEKKQWGYFAEHDDFRSATSQDMKRGWLTKVRGLAYGLPLTAGLILMLAAFSINVDNPPGPSTSPALSGERTNTSRSPRPVPQETEAPRNTFDAPPQPLPRSGDVKRYHTGRAVAPLEIRTRAVERDYADRHYFVKITDYETDRRIATAFVRGGDTTKISVPLGTFRLKYATGETWYGENLHFGPETVYSEADQALYFADQGNQYSGYTVELFLQRNGNLRTDRIGRDEF
ncbi:hypothetical protein CRI94_00485 [Longibacter salinarum]|uniref:J domain-containing protein n=1 Tax=Longibacter salinarum TaxID=1850348 RepID=A0A2A8D1X2_9BACT|nr:J domain-containing protein [Longibacter salinarum]PEN14807.1 hypothetical protein CRI94_00485 [Longibacter salinarum]